MIEKVRTLKRVIKRTVKNSVIFLIEICFPLTFIFSIWLRVIRKIGIENFHLTERVFMKVGILPVSDHYYQPLINPRKNLKKSLRDNRNLPGLDFNDKEQLEILSKFRYGSELVNFPITKTENVEYYYNNNSYESGDAEYLYSMVRTFRPRRIIEIGSGFSTLMIQNAIKANKLEDMKYTCDHTCIEPYEMPWLADLDVNLKRELVESIDLSFFEILDAGDFLFIDSSHIIRPQGDVLFEYLELLPVIKPGVIIHIHDIFSPKDYPDGWIFDEHRMWNEQYLLEAILSSSSQYRVIGAVNYLSHSFREEFKKKFPVFAMQQGKEPGAFWIVKN